LQLLKHMYALSDQHAVPSSYLWRRCLRASQNEHNPRAEHPPHCAEKSERSRRPARQRLVSDYCPSAHGLRFTSFAVASWRQDFHLQECAHAGRTKKNPAERGKECAETHM